MWIYGGKIFLWNRILIIFISSIYLKWLEVVVKQLLLILIKALLMQYVRSKI